jgi:hypothetical protein
VLDGLKGVALLVIRGVLLWVLVPLATITWLLTLIPFLIRRSAVGPRRFIRWFDLNLIAFLSRLLRLDAHQPFVGLTAGEVDSHRVGLLDLF